MTTPLSRQRTSHHTKDITATIHERPKKVDVVCAMLRRIWQPTGLSTMLKAKLSHSLVRPVAFYGAEAWTLLPGLDNLLDTKDIKWIRQFTRVSVSEELPNAEVRAREHCPVPLSDTCRQARLRYFGHLSHLPPGRGSRLALFDPRSCFSVGST